MIMAGNRLTLWEVLEGYADVRDELEDVLSSFEILQDDMELAMVDIRDDLERIQKHLDEYDSIFRRYKVPKEELPF